MSFEKLKEQSSAVGIIRMVGERFNLGRPKEIRMAGDVGKKVGTPDYIRTPGTVEGRKLPEGGGLSAAGVFVGGLLLGGIKLERKALMKLEGLISEKLIGLSGSGERDFEHGYKFARRFG